MLLRHLRYFTILARERHFARAAQACNISQPTLSGAVATLERELGAQLVLRGRRFLDLTPEGRLVLDGARQLLRDEDALLHGLEAIRGGLTGTLRLGVIPAAMPVVGMLTAPFCSSHPAVTVEIRSMSSKAIETELAAFDLDAGVTYLDNEPLSRVRRLPLYLEHYLFACPTRNPLAQRARVRWDEIAGERLCLLSGDMQYRRILDGVFGVQRLDIHTETVSNSFLAILAQLRSGRWSSIVPHSFAHLFGSQPDIALIPLVEPLHLQSIGLVISDHDPAPPLARALEASARTLDLTLLAGGNGMPG